MQSHHRPHSSKFANPFFQPSLRRKFATFFAPASSGSLAFRGRCFQRGLPSPHKFVTTWLCLHRGHPGCDSVDRAGVALRYAGWKEVVDRAREFVAAWLLLCFSFALMGRRGVVAGHQRGEGGRAAHMPTLEGSSRPILPTGQGGREGKDDNGRGGVDLHFGKRDTRWGKLVGKDWCCFKRKSQKVKGTISKADIPVKIKFLSNCSANVGFILIFWNLDIISLFPAYSKTKVFC